MERCKITLIMTPYTYKTLTSLTLSGYMICELKDALLCSLTWQEADLNSMGLYF